MSLGMKLGTNKPFFEVESNFLPELEDYYKHPSKYYLKPFRIVGNLYYIGDKKVCSHLIDTGEGLVMFDSGYQHTLHLMIQSIWELGFNPADIKYLIHSHGHFDHFGGANDFKELFCCKTLLSRIDAELLRNNPSASLIEYSPNPYASLFVPDIELEDGDIISLGNTNIRCVLSPGHTPGTMTFFFDAHDNKRTYKVGYFGGVGFLPLYKVFLRKYNLPMNMQEEFSKSIQRLKSEQVDIVLGNHPNHNGTLEKRARMLEYPSENPFIDSKAWKLFLNALETRLTDFINKGY